MGLSERRPFSFIFRGNNDSADSGAAHLAQEQSSAFDPDKELDYFLKNGAMGEVFTFPDPTEEKKPIDHTLPIKPYIPDGAKMDLDEEL